jgi:hypothetical protein
MPRLTRWLTSARVLLATAAFGALSACAGSQPQLSAAAAPPPGPGQARIWFYRDFDPALSYGLANVMLNGLPAGSVQPDGSVTYRDVPPGSYRITAESYGIDVNQSRDVSLAPGQQAYAKIVALSGWAGGGGNTQYSRDTFYVYLIPPQQAQVDLTGRALRSGS